MYLALSTCVLFISLMQPKNGTHFLNITFFFVLIAVAPVAVVLLSVIIPLSSVYASL